MKNNLIIYFILFSLILQSCREPFDPETDAFISALVVEATITNEMKQQKISLSETYVLEANEPTIVNNATVWVEDELNNHYTFSQDDDGNYISDIAFQAVPETQYTLYITTDNGKNYQSTTTTLTPISQINNLYAELNTEDPENIGVEVLVDSYNENDAQYFRYEYEEAYKVVVPNYFHFDAEITNIEYEEGFIISYQINFVPKTQEEKTCYSMEESIGILQASTNNLTENNLLRFPITFLSKNNSKIRDRYSILVRQYVQNLEAYTYYKIVNQLGGLQSLLSQNQSGYVTGNISATNNEDEKVIGYFEVATVDSKRIYFNYEDFNLQLPPWFYTCYLQTYDYNKVENPDERYFLYTSIANFDYHPTTIDSPVYNIVNKECSDCTSFSSNIRPDFWED